MASELPAVSTPTREAALTMSMPEETPSQMYRVPSFGRLGGSGLANSSWLEVTRGSSFAYRVPSPGPGLVAPSAKLLDSSMTSYIEASISKNLRRMAKGIPTDSFVEHIALERQKGIYMQITVYQGEPALGDQVMKSDHWENANKLTFFNIPGVHNLRQVSAPPSVLGFDLWGLGQPTTEGLQKVVNMLTADKNYQRIVWINLREEPVAYISGTPFAPRDKDTLNINLEHLLGIEGLDLESMEGRLKADIFASVREKNGKFSYYMQNAKMENELREVTLDTESSVVTLREIFNKLALDDGFNVEYYRIPITDECAPEEKDFDEIVNVTKDAGSDTAVVFNCQLGRGRTTTGLVCGYLIAEMRNGWTPAVTPPMPDPTNPDYTRGEYAVILQLIASLEDGELVKAQVDQAIDACSALQNLRTAIADCKVSAAKGAEGRSAEFWEKRGLNYLERYWWLILFNAYLRKHAPKYNKPFSEWMKSKWGLRRMLRKLELR